MTDNRSIEEKKRPYIEEIRLSIKFTERCERLALESVHGYGSGRIVFGIKRLSNIIQKELEKELIKCGEKL